MLAGVYLIAKNVFCFKRLVSMGNSYSNRPETDELKLKGIKLEKTQW